MDTSKFIVNEDLLWSGVLKGIAKSSIQLQPIFEALTNSLEAIVMRKNSGDNFNPYIDIEFRYNSSVDNENGGLISVTIKDNGIGFDEINFKRLIRYKDDTKGFNNRGSGRIQLIHYFNKANYISRYKEHGQLKKRTFSLSKHKTFLAHSSIIYNEGVENVPTKMDIETTLVLEDLLDKKDIRYYDNICLEELKDIIINRYLLYFCIHKDDLPIITLRRYLNNKLIETHTIEKLDIPEPSKDDEVVAIPLYKMSDDMKHIEQIDNEKVPISIKSYKLPSNKLVKNEIKITSKGEIVDYPKVKITCLEANDTIDSSRYLFLLSSNYFDELDGDTRGHLNILDKIEFKKYAKEHGSIKEQIILNDIEGEVNRKASQIFEEIAFKVKEQIKVIETLKQRYLLNEEALTDASLNDSVEDILKKSYTYDAKLLARQDAEYDEKIKKLEDINTLSPTYRKDLDSLVEDLVKTIPLQNRASLSRYVARRKMVIDLMEKLLDKKTKIQLENERNEDERLLHNLLFTQHSNNPNESDLWILNEEYLYFKGFSEHKLNQIEIDGKKLFREEITQEEERYLTSLGADRRLKRPDILLFPIEGKCIILELKNPNVDVSIHLNQINKYAYFLRNFATSDFVIDTFYGYFIGENIEPREVRAADGDFRFAPKLKYLFRPNKTIPDDSGTNHDGNLYTEVIEYTVLKERAKIRNKAFIDRLFTKQESFSIEKNNK